ncbi:MAG: DNA-processing protein DprA [Bacteroidaceae bacterium]|nr:DNA-processing protein DprA [Bacteroidaceae bacterium]
MSDSETLYSMALTRIPRLNVPTQRILMEALGSATAIYENCHDIKSVLPDVSPVLQENLSRMDEFLPRVQQELEWARSKRIQCITLGDEAYPGRLRECPDAPIVLYYRGNADLNNLHIINMVGTRQCTEYGKDICRNLLAEMAQLCPDCLVVSGLAYGIDIHAHREALSHGLKTIGVLAHGLDRVYPRMHQETAKQMLTQGGLLTEYMSGTTPEKMNFVARNRIVAGMCDATIVVESAAKGGSLITAEIANDYNRDVFAFPGRVGDTMSMGCHKLIRQDKAHLITSATDIIELLGWPSKEAVQQAQQPIQRELFPELSDEERRIVDCLQGSDGKAINQISIESVIPIGQLSAILFTLEMRGVVKLMAGGMYRLL